MRIASTAAAMLACLLAIPCSADEVAAPSGPPEPSTSYSAKALYDKCKTYDPICYSYLDRMSDWMFAHPEKVGKLCDTGPRWTDSKGAVYAHSPPAVLATFYMNRSNTPWFRSAGAHDAAIWTIQAMYKCKIGTHLAEPGQPDFPSTPQ